MQYALPYFLVQINTLYKVPRNKAQLLLRLYSIESTHEYT